MQDYKEISTMLEKAEKELSDPRRKVGTQFLNGVIATLRWILFNDERPIEK